MTTAVIDDTDEQKWPAVEAAYNFVIPSYQMLLSRYEAADTRLTTLITVVSTVTFGGPALARAVHPSIQFDAPAYQFAMLAALCAGILAICGRMRGRIVIPNPTGFYDAALHEHPWEFKKDAIYFAGKHFTANAQTIHAKGNFAVAASIALLIQIWMLTIWIVPISSLNWW